MAVLRLPKHNDIGPGFPRISEALRGTVAETRVATAVCVQAPNATVAFPLLDNGFDIYLRRRLTLRVHPAQVKARSFLGPDGQFEVAVRSLRLDPKGYVILPYIAPPDFQLQGKLWAIPIPEFIKLAQRDGEGYIFSSYFGRGITGPDTAFLAEVDKLASQWLATIPDWTSPVPELLAGTMEEVPRPQAQALGRVVDLWLASELMRAGMNRIVIAEATLRMDCVDMLVHHLDSFAVAGLMVHASSIEQLGGRQIVDFRLRKKTFFTDPGLFFVGIVCQEDRSPEETAYLIPSVDIPRLVHAVGGDPAYVLRFRIDRATKFSRYAVPIRKLAATIIDRLSAAAAS